MRPPSRTITHALISLTPQKYLRRLSTAPQRHENPPVKAVRPKSVLSLRDDPPHTSARIQQQHIQEPEAEHVFDFDSTPQTYLTPLPRPPSVEEYKNRWPRITQPIFDEYFPPLHERGWEIKLLPADHGTKTPLLKRHFRLSSLPKTVQLVHDMLNIIHDENHTTACLLVSYHAQPGVTVYLYTHASKILPSEGGISLMDVRVAVMLEFMFLAKVALGKGYEWSQDEELEKSATPPTWKKFEEVVTKYSSRNKVAADIPHKAKVASPLKLIPLPSPPPIRNSNSSTPLTQAIFEEYIYPLYERGWGINFIPSDSGKRIPVLKRHFRLGSSRNSSKLLQTIALVLKDENHTTPHISISIQNHEPTITVLLNTNAKAGITLLDVRAAVILENRFREKYKWEAERGDEVERDEGMEWEAFKKEILERPRRGMRSEWDVKRVEEGVLGLSVLEETAATLHHTLPSTEDNPPQEKEVVPERALPESSLTGSKISMEDILQSESVTPSITPTEGIPLTYRAGMFERAIPPPPAPDEYLPPMNDLDLSLSPDDFDPFLMEGMLSPQTPLSSTEHARSPLPDKPLPTEKDIPEPPEPAAPSPESSLPHPPSTERYKGRWPWINQTVFEEYMFPLYERRWNMRLVPGDYPGNRIVALERQFHHFSFAKSARFLEECMDMIRDENRLPVYISISTRRRRPIVTVLLYTKGSSVILPSSVRNDVGERAGIAGITLMDVKLAVRLENMFQEKFVKAGKGFEPSEEVDEECEEDKEWRGKPDWKQFRSLLASYSKPRSQTGVPLEVPRERPRMMEEIPKEMRQRMEDDVDMGEGEKLVGRKMERVGGEEEDLRWDDAIDGLYRLRDRVNRELSIKDLRTGGRGD